MKWIIAGFAALMLVGCATKQVRPGDAHFVPADRAIALQTPVDGGGAVTIVRDAGFLGGGCYAGVFVNGTLAAKLNPSEKVRLYLPAGRSIIGAHSVGAALCGMKIQARGERASEIIVTAGDNLFFRLALSTDGTVTVTPLVQ
ncbi:hypothetical protein [Rhodanobacter sp. OR87]|uniref:hypothetical protein n=1 Tax=Rhodanobacter sp. OR87 TaxID=1076523 RepID=UPI0012DED17B|nr:hypothetical protein [Rhodanobacter sp. OR87]